MVVGPSGIHHTEVQLQRSFRRILAAAGAHLQGDKAQH